MAFRIFKRVTYKRAPGWPDGYKPNPVPMDSCRTIEIVDSREAAIDYCTERNLKWRKYMDAVQRGVATIDKRRVYYTAPRYEFTEI